MAKKVRNSNFEMLRIISMFAIVFGHLFMFTDWKMPINLSSLTLINFSWVGAKWGVNLFVLISAYFLSSSSHIHWKSLGTLWGETYFYNWACMFCLPLIGLAFNPGNILTGFFPILRGAYWFVTAYFVMILVSPFLNMVIRQASKKQLLYLFLVLFIFLSIGPTFLGTQVFEPTNATGVAWLVFIYICGGILRRFSDEFKKISFPRLWIFTIINILIIFCWVFFTQKFQASADNPFSNLFVNFSNKAMLGGVNPLSDGSSPFELFASLSTFVIVMKMAPHHSKIINRVAGSTFAVYLISTSPFGQALMTNVVGKLNLFQGHASLLLLRALIVSVSFFAIYVLIDQALKLVVAIIEKAFIHIKKLV